MIAYLDTNVYISAKYKFSSGKFASLCSLIAEGDLKVIYSSATQGEVEQHISRDIRVAVTEYNRLLRKGLSPINGVADFELKKIDEDTAVAAVKDAFVNFLSLDGVTKIELNPLDAEQLMQAYFSSEAPFETKKPNEFKDAIMINAVKQYQQEVREQIVVVSGDNGFIKAFEGNDEFIPVEYLGNLIRMCNEKAEYLNMKECIIDLMENDDFYYNIKDHFSKFDVDLTYYEEWECNEMQIDSIEGKSVYIEFVDGRYLAHIDIVLWVFADITHRDEDTSYFDREEQRYLIENYVTWREEHRIETSVVIACTLDKEDGEYAVLNSTIVDDRQIRTFDLDARTLQSFKDLKTEYRENEYLEFCSECGKIIGFTTNYTDYYDNPLCRDCMIIDENGDICPTCGRKVPHEFMNSGFCINCFNEQD